MATGGAPTGQPALSETNADAVVQLPCDQAAFDVVLATVQTSGGGTITFNCGMATIVFTTAKVIQTNVTIDGANRITLSGGNASQLFWVSSGSLTLRKITLTNGYSASDGGAIVNAGALIVEDSTIQNSTAVLSGGAILSIGPVTITNSTLTGNRAASAGAVYPRFSAARTVIINSRLRDNHATSTNPDVGWGGAILPWDGADVTIQGGEITSNTAIFGAGIHNRFSNSSVSLSGVRVSGNQASRGGGIYNQAGVVSISGVSLFTNSATFGGGVFNFLGTVTVNNTTLCCNDASDGGGFFNTEGVMIATNTTFSRNIARGGGSSIFNEGGAITLTNATLSRDSANLGVIYQFSTQPLTLKNVVLNAAQTGDNCDGNFTAGRVPPASAGFNWSDDASCTAYFNQPGDTTNADPKLGPLAANGGPTPTHLPASDSPLRDAGQCVAGITVDQRGVPRPQGVACDIGAVETRPQDYERKVYIPLTLR
jgi:hypothetical protein